jgi:hypothetical protein
LEGGSRSVHWNDLSAPLYYPTPFLRLKQLLSLRFVTFLQKQIISLIIRYFVIPSCLGIGIVVQSRRLTRYQILIFRSAKEWDNSESGRSASREPDHRYVCTYYIHTYIIT